MAISTSAIQDKLGRNASFSHPSAGDVDESNSGLGKSKLAQAIHTVLSQSEQQPDNQQQLAQIQSLIQQLDKDQLKNLIDSMPDTSISRWIQEIRKTNHSNSGLSADQRRDFFTLLAQNLSPEQLERWEVLLPQELQNELHDARQQDLLLRNSQESLGSHLDLYSDINQFALRSAAFSSVHTLDANSSGNFDDNEASPTINTDVNEQEPDLANKPEVSVITEESISNEFTRALENITLALPDVEPSVHMELAQSYVLLQTTLEAYNAGDTDAPLLAQIEETNLLFRDIGGTALLQTYRSGRIVFTYDSSNVPKELRSRAQRRNYNDREYGDSGWSMQVSIGQMPASMLPSLAADALGTIDGRATQARSDQYDRVRGFEFDENAEAALLYLEHELFGTTAVDHQRLSGAVVNLGIHQGNSDGQLYTQIVNGDFQISSHLLSDSGVRLLVEPVGETVWVNAEKLSIGELIAVADTLRTQSLEINLDEGGALKFDQLQRAIAALDTTRTPEENKKLALQGLKLERSIALVSNSLPSDIHDTLRETATLYSAAGIPVPISSYKNGNLFVEYTSSTLPRDLRHYSSRRNSDDKEFNEAGWYVRIPITQLSDTHLVKYAKSQLIQPAYYAASSHLSQIDQFEGHVVSHDSDFQILIDQSSPVEVALLPDDTPPLAELLRSYDLTSDTASSKNDNDYENLALISFDIASSLLSDNPDNLSEEQIKELHTWINGTNLGSLGNKKYYDQLQSNGDEWERILYGAGGSFGVGKSRFAQAWLASSKLERLEYLGISEERWNQAEMYIASGLQAEGIAKDIRQAEFGFDDVVKIGFALTFAYATGGAASGFVAGALGGTAVSAATATFLAGAAGGAASGFSSTFILTDGDMDAALKSGLMGALTGGLGEYASSLSGSNKIIAEAIISGVAAEVSGSEFLEGVLASVSAELGDSVALQLKGRMPDFVASFSGKVVEIAVRVQGDPDRLQAELEQYVIDYASGKVRTSLTATMGPEYKHLANSLGDLAGVVIANGGDMSKVRDYLSSDAFYRSFGNNVGNHVMESFGGKENFAAVLSGRITNLVIASRGDMDLIEQGMEGLALSVVGDWAGRRMTSLMNSTLTGDERPIADAMGGLVNVAIASGWNDNAINAYMNGPLVAALGEEGADAIPDRFGGPEGFLASALEHLTASYSANNGDMDKVAEDMTHFLFGRLIDFHENKAATEPLTVGASGARVTELQDKLREHGYLDSSSSGVFDQQTLSAMTDFQNDQIAFLDQQLDTETNITLRGYINGEVKLLTIERDANEFGIVTSELVNQPYATKHSSGPIGGDTADWANAQLIDLGVGSEGPGVTRLQHVLTDLGYDPGSIDGVFGDNTAIALKQFQQDQLKLVQDKLPEVSSINQPEFYDFLTTLGSDLVVEQSQDKTGARTADLLKNPITSAQLNDPALNGALSVDDMASFIRGTINNEPQEGLVKVGLLSSIFGNATSLEDIAGMLAKQSPSDITKVIDKVGLDDIEKWASQMSEMSVDERAKLSEVLTKNLDGERLARFYGGMSEPIKREYVDTISKLGDDQLKEAFLEAIQPLVDNSGLIGAAALGTQLPFAANQVIGNGAVKAEIAANMIQNVANGQPPWRPGLGNVGGVAWFVTDGNPYTSAASEAITLPVEVDLPPAGSIVEFREKDLVEIFEKALPDARKLAEQQFRARNSMAPDAFLNSSARNTISYNADQIAQRSMWESIGTRVSSSSSGTGKVFLENSRFSKQGDGVFTLTNRPNAIRIQGGTDALLDIIRTNGVKAEPKAVAAAEQLARQGKILGTVQDVVRVGGKVLIIVGVVGDVVKIYTAEDRIREFTKTTGGWAGAATGVALYNTATGATNLGGPAPWVLNALGNIVSAGVGYWAGSEIVEKVYDLVVDGQPIEIPAE